MEVTRVEEMVVDGVPLGMFVLDFDADELDRHPWVAERFLGEGATMPLSFHTFALAVGDRRILVDTGCGNGKPRTGLTASMFGDLDTPYLGRLGDAGFPPEEVDTVVCTHLHVDHVGWNTTLVDGRWEPTFPHARYLFVDRDVEHWARQDEEMHAAAFADSVRPVMEAGLADLVPPDHVVCPEVRLEPTPGHTPGHASVVVASGGASAVITGDMAHHPFQLAVPTRSSFADTDPVLAARTRQDFVDRYADTGTLVLGTHFSPTAGYLRRDGGVVLAEAP
ncbi:MAG TPA: MBL fold metallo-hydrolase [Acidimicrobiales bacterium]|nr:MBL fold metallo-hydrolase [Acidimicrobiales bacterium]